MTLPIRSILILCLSIFSPFVHANEAPRSWLRARADLAEALTGVFIHAQRPEGLSAVDWRPSFRALMRSRRRAHGYDVEKVMAFVVDGAMADARMRANVDDPALDAAVREGLTAELRNEPKTLLRGKLRLLSVSPIAAMVTNGAVGMGGMVAVAITSLAHHVTGPDYGAVETALSMGMISVSSIGALGVIASEGRLKIDRVNEFVDQCRRALTKDGAN